MRTSLSAASLNSDVTFRMPVDGIAPLPHVVAPEFSQLIGAEAPLKTFRNYVILQQAVDARRVNQFNVRIWGKKTIVSDLIGSDLSELLSLRGRPSIEFKAISGDTDHESTEGRRTAFATYSLVFGLQALHKLYLTDHFPKNIFRGWEDFLQIINLPIILLTVGCELFVKLIGAALIQPFRKGFTLATDKTHSTPKRVLGAILALLCLPFWLIAQPFFVTGNGLGQLRRVIDATCNLASSTLAKIADLFRIEQRYGIKYPNITHCTKILLKNTLQLLPKIILLGAALFPGGQALPAMAGIFSPALKTVFAPAGQLFSSMYQSIAQGFASLFPSILAKSCGAGLSAGSIAVAEQCLSGCTNKIGRLAIWYRPINRSSAAEPLHSQPHSSSNEELLSAREIRRPHHSTRGSVSSSSNRSQQISGSRRLSTTSTYLERIQIETKGTQPLGDNEMFEIQPPELHATHLQIQYTAPPIEANSDEEDAELALPKPPPLHIDNRQGPLIPTSIITSPRI